MRFPLLFLPFLAACGSIVPETARQLSGLDPLTADPAGFAVTLALPEGYGIQPGGAEVSLTVENPGLGEAGGLWALEETTDGTGNQSYRFAEADLDEVRRVQATASAWESSDPDGTQGSLSVSVDPCRMAGAAPDDDPRVSVFLAVLPGAPMAPLVRNAPLAEVMSDQDRAALPDCP